MIKLFVEMKFYTLVLNSKRCIFSVQRKSRPIARGKWILLSG